MITGTDFLIKKDFFFAQFLAQYYGKTSKHVYHSALFVN